MATLHVRNVPERFYDRLKRLAKERNRSLSAEVLTLLKQALREEEELERHNRALRELDAIRNSLEPLPWMPNAEDLIREDRDGGHRDE